MATEALNVIAATQLANRIDFVFIISWGFYLIIPRSMAKASIFVDKKRGKGRPAYAEPPPFTLRRSKGFGAASRDQRAEAFNGVTVACSTGLHAKVPFGHERFLELC
jgi:hypothetical protein